MASANWGTKRRCATCGAAYYDLNRDPVICPKCHSTYVAAAPRVPLRSGSKARTIEPTPPEPAEAGAFEEDEVLDHTDENEDGDIPHDADRNSDDEEMRE